MSLASPLFLFMPAETPETLSKAFYVLGNNFTCLPRNVAQRSPAGREWGSNEFQFGRITKSERSPMCTQKVYKEICKGY